MAGILQSVAASANPRGGAAFSAFTIDYLVVGSGGGGGSRGVGGSGGSGVAIVQYPGGTVRGTFNPPAPVTTLNPGAYVRHTITGSTTWTVS